MQYTSDGARAALKPNTVQAARWPMTANRLENLRLRCPAVLETQVVSMAGAASSMNYPSRHGLP